MSMPAARRPRARPARRRGTCRAGCRRARRRSRSPAAGRPAPPEANTTAVPPRSRSPGDDPDLVVAHLTTRPQSDAADDRDGERGHEGGRSPGRRLRHAGVGSVSLAKRVVRLPYPSADLLPAPAGPPCRRLSSSAPPPSTSGPGHHPFKVVARVRIPLGAYEETPANAGVSSLSGPGTAVSRTRDTPAAWKWNRGTERHPCSYS